MSAPTMVEMASYTLPLYEAVVCGLTLNKIQEKEEQRRDGERLVASIKLEAKLRETLELFRKSNFSNVALKDVKPIATALSTLVLTLRALEPRRRNLDNLATDPYRPALTDLAQKIEEGTEQLEEIAEAWCVATNESSLEEIRAALSAAGDHSVDPWRVALASIKD